MPEHNHRCTMGIRMSLGLRRQWPIRRIAHFDDLTQLTQRKPMMNEKPQRCQPGRRHLIEGLPPRLRRQVR